MKKIADTTGLKIKLMLALILWGVAGPVTISGHRFLNYSTGEFFEGDYWNRDLWPVTDSYEEGMSRILEWDINYAIVEDSPWYAGCVRWLIPGFAYSNWEGKPEVPITGHSFELPDGYRSVHISIVEAQYKDFNYSLQPGLPPVPDDMPQRFVDIEPYEGFFPEVPYNDNGVGIYRGTYIVFVGTWPVSYDYEHSIVRAYMHLKLRLEYSTSEAGVEEGAENETLPAEYYTLQGIKTSCPVKGAFYIERRGLQSRKILF